LSDLQLRLFPKYLVADLAGAQIARRAMMAMAAPICA
jgi:hypothetical protein